MFESDVKDLRAELIKKVKDNYGFLNDEEPLKVPIKSLDEILVKPEMCYKILMDHEPPIISKDFSYLFGPRKKSVISAWVQVLKERGYFTDCPSEKELVIQLNHKFLNLNMGKDGRTLRSPGQNTYHDFIKEFKSKIPNATID